VPDSEGACVRGIAKTVQGIPLRRNLGDDLRQREKETPRAGEEKEIPGEGVHSNYFGRSSLTL